MPNRKDYEEEVRLVNFALTGVAGFVAPRHLRAIKATGNRLVAALDPHDSVGILDSFFPEAAFFREFERFDRHLDKLRRTGQSERVDIVSICSPNHLHDAHVRLALRIGADALCEKPLVINPWNLDALLGLERESGRRVFTVLQLRLHPDLVCLKSELAKRPAAPRHRVVLTYVTARGPWYQYSWKGQEEKSGGVVTNIGIHFFDLLIWLFGRATGCEVHVLTPSRASGFLTLEHADVTWLLSIDPADLPPEARDSGKRTFRLIEVDGREVEFSEGFADLHTEVYRHVLTGAGFGIEDARPSIELVSRIRHTPAVSSCAEPHPWLHQ